MKDVNEIFSGTGLESRPEVCEKHGDFLSRRFLRSVWTGCPACQQEKIAKKAEEDAKAAMHEKRLALARKISGSGIPERFRDRTIESFIADTPQKKAALTFARSYAEQFWEALESGRGALFVGRPGTGKTHLAAGIGLHVMQAHGRSVLFTTFLRAVRRVKDTWSRGSDETESQAIESMVAPDLLIIDEVGVQFGSETEKLIAFDVLNERYEKRRPTILLSNLNLDDVRSFLGERVFDRMREDGGEVVVFAWESHRGTKKADFA